MFRDEEGKEANLIQGGLPALPRLRVLLYPQKMVWVVLRDLWILRLRQILAVLLCFPVFPRFWSFLALLPLLIHSL